MSFVCWTMSNAFEKSIDMATVLCGGLSCGGDGEGVEFGEE